MRAEYFITQQSQLSYFIVINRNEDNASIRKELFRNLQSPRHEGEPFGVAVAVFGIDEGVVVDEVFVAGDVGRVNVDHIVFAGMGVC